MADTDDGTDLVATRRRKLGDLRAAGIDPYPHAYPGVRPVAAVKAPHEALADGEETVIAEAGGMCFMEEGIEFETKMGDGSAPVSGFMGAFIGVMIASPFLKRTATLPRIASWARVRRA